MNLKRLFIALLAASVAFAACEEKEDLGVPRIEVNPDALTFSQGEGSNDVELTATRDWLIASQPDWVGLSVNSGKASTKAQKVSVSVDSNSGYNRTGKVVFTIGLAKVTLNINQDGAKGELKKGSGTQEDPYTILGVIEYVRSLGSDVQSPSNVYFKGKVDEVVTTYAESGTYGNATFYLVDEGAVGGERFYCFQTLYLGNAKWTSSDPEIQKGDNVVVCGKVVNYKGNTPETVSKGGSFVFNHNGVEKGGGGGNTGTTGPVSGTGTEADPFNVAAAIDAVKNLTWTSKDNFQKVGPYYVKGKVESVDENFSAEFGNATFTMVDQGYDAAFTAYRVLYLGNKKWTSGGETLKKGDDVIIYAELMNYRGNTPETSGGYVYSLNGNTGSGTEEPPVTATLTEAIALADNAKVIVNECIVAALTSQGFVATDGTSNVYVYQKAEPAAKVGDKVKVEATKTTYYGLPEFTDPKVTVISGGNDVPRTALKDITSVIDTYDASIAEYICVTGTLVKDGNFFNIEVPGATRKATTSSLHASIDPSALAGTQVTMTGYFNTIYASKNLVQVIVTEFKPADPNAKYCNVSPTAINVKADATSASFEIKANAAWTVTSDNAAFTVSPASGKADATVTVSFSANEGDAARTANIKVVCPDASVEAYVAITQAKPSSGQAQTIEVDFTVENAALPQGSSAGLQDGTYTLSGYSFTMHAADKFYQAKSNDMFYLLIGKKDSYILLPAVEGKALTKVKFLTGASASENVVVDIAKKDGTLLGINSSKLKKGTEYEWEITGAEAGANYRIAVTNTYNAQFQNIILVYE